jgi:biopolymer transport protein ExbD
LVPGGGEHFPAWRCLQVHESRTFSEPMLNAFGASMAGVFLLLALCAALPARSSHGVWFELFHVIPQPPCCIDGRTVVVEAKPDKTVLVNRQTVDEPRAARLVTAMMENRAERAVYFVADRQAAVQDVANLATKLNSSTDGLHIGILTLKQRDEITSSYPGGDIINLDRLAWPQCPGLMWDLIPILAGCR